MILSRRVEISPFEDDRLVSKRSNGKCRSLCPAGYYFLISTNGYFQGKFFLSGTSDRLITHVGPAKIYVSETITLGSVGN